MTELHGDFNCLDKDKNMWIPLFLTCLAFADNGQAALEKDAWQG